MLSVLMAALMVVSIMPVTGSNNIVAKASTASAESSVVTWSAADILAAQEGDSGLVLCGSGWANNNATDDKTFEDGFSALGDNAKAGSTKAQTDGKTAAGTVPDNGCYVKYTAPVNGTLAINTKIGKNKTFYVIAEDGTKVAEVKNGTSGSTYNTVKAEVEAGKTYYAYLGGATAQSWKVYYSQLNKKTVVDWESVAKPVISKVEAGADGFTVTVEGIVDEYNGAEDIVVTMLHNDGQAGEAVIKRSEGTATVNFTAHESGDYTFVATAQ